jgi:hypothetical protein
MDKQHIEFTVLEKLREELSNRGFLVFAKKIEDFEEELFDADRNTELLEEALVSSTTSE